MHRITLFAATMIYACIHGAQGDKASWEEAILIVNIFKHNERRWKIQCISWLPHILSAMTCWRKIVDKIKSRYAMYTKHVMYFGCKNEKTIEESWNFTSKFFHHITIAVYVVSFVLYWIIQ